MTRDEEDRILARYDIDPVLTRGILDAWNNGDPSVSAGTVRVAEIPRPDGTDIIDRNAEAFTIPEDRVRAAIKKYRLPLSADSLPRVPGGGLHIAESFLREAGILLYPLFSFGVLNGGSATSYLDSIRNQEYNPAYFRICKNDFERHAASCREEPKGVIPAFYNEDMSAGPSFMELKFRSLYLAEAQYRRRSGERGGGPFPLFQMTSVRNNQRIASAYERFAAGVFLKNLREKSGADVLDTRTGIQPMIGAFTHSSRGKRKEIFFHAYGEPDRPLPLPGGHGQNFSILADIYRELYAQGKRFISIGNVDNLGYTPDPVILGYLGLSGRPAAFEFSRKTRTDVKGGILVRDERGRLTCADIGPAIPRDAVLSAEAAGKPILFNCASGFFDLEYLVSNLDAITSALPIRFSDQNKDAGQYSQAEQITWEVIGLLKKPLIFAVQKSKRFLASKLLLENFLTSSVRMAEYRSTAHTDDPFPGLSDTLRAGLADLLRDSYAMTLRNGRWEPMETG